MSDIKFTMSAEKVLTVEEMEIVYQTMADVKRLRKLYDAPGHALPGVGPFLDQEMIEAVAPSYGQEILRRVDVMIAQLGRYGFTVVTEEAA